MHLSKEQIVKLVVDAIGPDLCPINELFEKLSNSVEGSFMPFKNFCGFINKRSTLFDFFVVDGTILVRKKVEVKDDEAHVLEAIGPGSCQITDLLRTVRGRVKGAFNGKVKEFRRYIQKRPHLFELSMDKDGLIFVKKKTNDKDYKSSVQINTSSSLGNNRNNQLLFTFDYKK